VFLKEPAAESAHERTQMTMGTERLRAEQQVAALELTTVLQHVSSNKANFIKLKKHHLSIYNIQ